MWLAFLFSAALSCAEPPPEPAVVRGPALFAEADGQRAVVAIGGGASRGEALHVEEGRLVAGIVWGPAFVVLDAEIPGDLRASAPSVSVGLRVPF